MTNPLDFFRKGRSDLSNFLIHLTKDGTFEEWRSADYIPDSFFFGSSTTLKARDSLEAVLKGAPPTLLARAPFGIFKLIGINAGRKTKKGIHPDWLKCVCFSETPLHELAGFYKATQDPRNWSLKANRYQKYGIAFSSSTIRKKGGHPIFYYDRANKPMQAAIEQFADPSLIAVTKPLLPFFEPYGPKLLDPAKEVDFRWEREWRIQGNCTFDHGEIAFGICPEGEIAHFEALVNNKFPFIDPDWDLQSLKDYLSKNGWKKLAEKL